MLRSTSGPNLSVVTARDAGAIQEFSYKLLRDHRASLTPDIQDFVLRASMLGNIVNGNRDLALKLAGTVGREIRSPDNRGAERAYLRYYAQGLSKQNAASPR